MVKSGELWGIMVKSGLSMFFGEFEYKIDEKGRVPIPPRFRRYLKEGVMLAPGVEKCITIYPVAEWKNLAENLTSSSVTRSKLRRLKRAIFATAFNLYMDGQGRIALPNALRQYAEIVDEVVVAGANNYLELWNKVHWDEEKAISQEQAWQIIESLERQ
jgi:MraZ protein